MENLLITLPVLIFSVVLHEVAHGWVAYKQGDPTAAMLGRLTLNPVPHIDPVGSLLLPGMLAVLPYLTGSPSGFIFGWAKPVPVNPRNFRNYKRGDILVSLAGVAVNFLLAIAFTVVLAGAEWGLRLAPGLVATWQILAAMAFEGIQINFVLVLFNLIPVPPLDGSHVFYYLLPPRLAVRYRQIGPRGLLLLLLLLWVGGFAFLSWPHRLLMGAALQLKDALV